MKKFLVALIAALALTSLASADAYEGYTLFSPLDSGKGTEADHNVYLLDMDGEIVHTWETNYNRGRFAFLDEDGTLIIRGETAAQPQKITPNSPAILQELDWDGNVIWEWTNEYFHHDMAKLPNGNYLVILWEEMTDENRAKLDGCDNKTNFWADMIAEVDRNSGEIIYEWHLQDELEISDYAFSCKGPSTEWNHLNALEYLPEGNPFNGEASFMISSRMLNKVFIVNIETGDVEWESQDGILTAQHDPTLLENGNILVFNNLYTKKSSQVIEIDPQTDEVIWDYTSPDFFSSFISGAERLPNGNTLITEGDSGRLFEVTPEGETVWEYTYKTENTGTIFRAYRYALDAYDWPFENPDVEVQEPEIEVQVEPIGNTKEEEETLSQTLIITSASALLFLGILGFFVVRRK